MSIDAATIARHADSVHALAMRLSPTDGEDLAQSALLKAWRHRDTFRPGADPAPWLRSILVRVFLSHVTSTRLRAAAYERLGPEIRTTAQASGGGFSEATRAAAQGHHGEQRLELSVLRERIECALTMVSEEHEEMLRLVDLAGCSYKEAAAKTGVPIGTVMSRLHRARRAAAAELRRIESSMQ